MFSEKHPNNSDKDIHIKINFGLENMLDYISRKVTACNFAFKAK